jgi:hypothetical protein
MLLCVSKSLRLAVAEELSLFAGRIDAAVLSRTALPTVDQSRKLARRGFASVPATVASTWLRASAASDRPPEPGSL